jgi:hypothetical protein
MTSSDIPSPDTSPPGITEPPVASPTETPSPVPAGEASAGVPPRRRRRRRRRKGPRPTDGASPPVATPGEAGLSEGAALGLAEDGGHDAGPRDTAGRPRLGLPGFSPPGALSTEAPPAGEPAPKRRRRRRRKGPRPAGAAAAGEPASAAPGAPPAEGDAPTPGAQPTSTDRPARRRRRRRPREGGDPQHAADAGAPADRPSTDRSPTDRPHTARPPHERGDRPRRERDERPRGDRDRGERGPRGAGKRGPKDGRRDGGRDGPRREREQKLYATEAVVDRGFEDVADEAAEGGSRRADWTIVKRTMADLITRKPMSMTYVLKRPDGETEFPNLGAARAAVNKTIVHPEKLTRSKADYAALKGSKK